MKKEENKPQKPEVKLRITRKAIFMGIGGFAGVIGLIMFMFYVFTMNMAIGLPGVVLAFIGGGLFYYYWKKEEQFTTKSYGGPEDKKAQYNSLVIYPRSVIFQDVEKPRGVPWKCENDGKHYYVQFLESENANELKEFILPDLKYCDPRVFGERVLTLPAHRRLFSRKVDMFQKLKPLFAFGICVLLWILIITTTG